MEKLISNVITVTDLFLWSKSADQHLGKGDLVDM
jgi:hypothetical protein